MLNDFINTVEICKIFLDSPLSDKDDDKHKIQISCGEHWYTIRVGGKITNDVDHPFATGPEYSAYNMYKEAYKKIEESYPDLILIKTDKNIEY